ncbi:unnamed protein product [Caenorhabditis sp. 36 PRJEB53466]|nr:unnamed protein product [Caenorhabditis sp. 36 PRJEB53466]
MIADVAWIGQRVLLTLPDYQDPFDSRLFIVFSYIRVCCVFQGLLILPILVLERYFATIWFSDYESTSRTYISVLLVGLLTVVGNAAAYTFHEYESTFISISLVIVFNSLGILVASPALERASGKFTLCARFQIAENIKVCQLVNCIVLSMAGFNGLICFTLLLDNFDLSVPSRSLSLFAFDISALIYSTVFPYVCMHYCKRSKATFNRVIKKFFKRKRSIQPYTTPESGGKRLSITLRNTFGEIMTEISTDVYFRQLQQSWNK